MEKVLGIGGFFFRADDPAGLANWYASRLGVDPVPVDYAARTWQQEAGATVVAPFARDSRYFGAMDRQWMLNFRVRDLAAMVAQLEAQGVAVTVDPQSYPNGSFARFTDPEGNPVELWEPRSLDTDR